MCKVKQRTLSDFFSLFGFLCPPFHKIGTEPTYSPIPLNVPHDKLAEIAKRAANSFHLLGMEDEDARRAALDKINGQDDIVIALAGATGVGKTTFIRAIAGQIVQGTGHNLDASKNDFACLRIPIPNTKSHLVLVETPDIYDLRRTNGEIMDTIEDWMKISYNEDKKLDGIIYLYPITNMCFDSDSLGKLRLFWNLCGGEVYNKICLVTTDWNNITVTNMDTYDDKEASIKKDHLHYFLAKNSITGRFDCTTDTLAKETAINTLRAIIGHVSEKPMKKIQREVARNGGKGRNCHDEESVLTTGEKRMAQLFQLNDLLVVI